MALPNKNPVTWSALSLEVRQALASELMVYYVDRLNTQNKVSKEKEGVIARAIADMVMGTIIPTEFTTVIKERLNTDDQIAARIGREVRDVMLAPISKQLLAELKVDIRQIQTESAAPVARTTQIKTNPATTVNLKKPSVQVTVVPTAAAAPVGTVPAARVIQFKPAPAITPQQPSQPAGQQEQKKKSNVIEAENPFTLKEDPPTSP